MASDDDWFCSQTLSGHESTVWDLSFDADGARMVSCSDDCSLMFWELSKSGSNDQPGGAGAAKWRQIARLSGKHERAAYTVDWSSRGQIASGAADNAIRVFAQSEQRGGEVGAEAAPLFEMAVEQRDAHSGDVNCVRWAPNDPTLLASVGDDGLLKMWRLKL